MFEIVKIEAFSIDVYDPQIYDYEMTNFSSSILKKHNNHLSEGILNQLVEADNIFELKDIKNSLSNQFDVKISEFGKEMLEKGNWKLKFSDSKGGLLPTMYDETGKYAEQIALVPKNITKEMKTSLNNLAVQQQLATLVEQIEGLSNAVHRIERGQRDDRVGLVLSARQQFLEAISMTDKELQKMALVSAVSVANNAKFQLMQTMRSDIDLVVNKKKNKIKKNEIDMTIDNIMESLHLINETTNLILMCHSFSGQYESMVATLMSQRGFLETQLLKVNRSKELTNAEILHQNWNQPNDKWLEFPEEINQNIHETIETLKIRSNYVLEENNYGDKKM